MKWRNKPIIINADVYKDGDEDGKDLYCTFNGIDLQSASECSQCAGRKACAKKFLQHRPYINTLEGKHYITPGDYIITGIKGERSLCRADIFLATYDKV